MKIFIVAFDLIICVLFFAFAPMQVRVVFADTHSPLMQSISFAYEGKSWLYTKPTYSNFYLENLRQSRELAVQKQGIRETVIALKAKGQSDIDCIEYIYPDFSALYEQMCTEVQSTYKEPEVTFRPESSQMWEFSQEQIGKTIDTNDLLLNILNSRSHIDLKVHIQKPQNTKSELMQNTALMSSQSTSIVGSERGRRLNVQKALRCFNGLIVQSGQVVSFQDIITRNDDGTPYAEATIILHGEFVKGIGGGICQASTTIYNAVLMAGLQIVESHTHSLPVGYVERGFDATVNDNGLDLKFRNNTPYPIYIKTFATNDFVSANIYGQPLGDISYKKVSEVVQKIDPPSPLVIPDTDHKYIDHIKYKGEYFTTRYAQYGYKVKAYLQKVRNGEILQSTLLREATYAPTQSIIYEGTQVRDTNTNNNENLQVLR